MVRTRCFWALYGIGLLLLVWLERHLSREAISRKRPEARKLPQIRDLDRSPSVEHLYDAAVQMTIHLISVLRLVSALEESLPVSRKNLWSESDENFEARLKAALGAEASQEWV